MDKISLGEIKDCMNKIHAVCRRPLNNYYNNYSGDSDDRIFDCIKGSDTIVFGTDDNGIFRIYYYSADEDSLINSLKRVPEGSILDIVDRVRTSNYPYIEESGFIPYTTYIRFGRKLNDYDSQLELFKQLPLDEFYDESYGRPAQLADIQYIQEMIEKGFDPKTDHLFSDKDMEELIREGSVYVEGAGDDICCVLISRILGKKYYVNLIMNLGGADVSYSMEKKVLLEAIKNHGVNYQYAWIDERNKRALKRAGLPEDNQFNHIFEKKG